MQKASNDVAKNFAEDILKKNIFTNGTKVNITSVANDDFSLDVVFDSWATGLQLQEDDFIFTQTAVDVA